jgi:hypothetical protein
MNQNVRTTDNVTYANITGNTIYTGGGTTYYVNAGTSNLNQLAIGGLLSLVAAGGNGVVGTNNAIFGYLKMAGNKLNVDEQFSDGNNGISIYNNNGGSAVTHTRKNSSFADGHSGPPNLSGYVIEIKHSPATSAGKSPG